MQRTSSQSFDIDVLSKRLSCTDAELAFLLGSGISTARKLAAEAGAVFYINSRKLNNMRLIQQYIDNISSKG